MGAYFNGQIRVSSRIDDFQGPGQTEYAIRRALGPIPPLEGSVGQVRWEAHRRMAHTHDEHWGLISIWGDLNDFDDMGWVERWWGEVIRALSEVTGLGAFQGILQVQIDRGANTGNWVLDMSCLLEKGEELVGDE